MMVVLVLILEKDVVPMLIPKNHDTGTGVSIRE